MFTEVSCGIDRRLTAWKWYLGNAALLIIFFIVPVWIKTALHQYHSYDLGIFAQALSSISIADLNPYIPALDIKLFCDHFDPILILASPLAKIMEPAYAALIVEHLLVLLTPIPVIMLGRGRRELLSLECMAITYLLFNRGIISALGFPVHPTTWASLFFVIIGVGIYAKKWVWVFMASILLMACKEEFPFAVLMLGVGLAFRKQYRVGGGLLVLAALWLIIAFWLRPLFLGNTHGYASRVLTPLVEAPVATLWDRVCCLKEAKRLFQCIVPLIPAAYWLCVNRVQPDWVMLMAVAPLLAIRFVDGAWQFHYLAPVAPFLVLAVWRRTLPAIPRGYAVLSIVVTIISLGGPLSKNFAVYADVGRLFDERSHSIKQARAHLMVHRNGKALVEGNLVPLLAVRDYVFQVGGVQQELSCRFLLVEKPPNGDPWPILHSDVDRIISEWRSDSMTTVLKDDAHIFFAEMQE